MNERTGDNKHFVTFENDGWHFGDLSGPVATSIPIRRHRQFCELAVLISPERRTVCYAARVTRTERWLYFSRLHAWMTPIVEVLIGIQKKYTQITELIAQTHRLAQ